MKEYFLSQEWKNYIFLGEDEGCPVRTLVFRRSHCNWSKCERAWKWGCDNLKVLYYGSWHHGLKLVSDVGIQNARVAAKLAREIDLLFGSWAWGKYLATLYRDTFNNEIKKVFFLSFCVSWTFGVSSMPEGLGVDVPLPVLWPENTSTLL